MSKQKNNKIFKLLQSPPALFITATIIFLSFCYIDFSPSLKEIIKNSSILIGCISIVTYILNLRFSKQSIILFLLFAIELIASLVTRDADTSSFLQLYVRLIGLYLYLETAIRTNANKAISIISSIMWILVFINWITIVFFPHGLYESTLYGSNWFFGYDNLHIIWFLAAILASFIDRKINNTKIIKMASLLIMTTYCVYICMSANSVVSYTILLLYLIFSNWFNKTRLVEIKNSFIIYISINVLFVLLRVQNIFSWFIEGILGKNLTFTGRTIIWDRVMSLIKKKPILGYGYESASTMSERLGSPYYTHAHNTILDICYKGGIVSSLLFLWLLFSLKDCLKKCSSVVIKNFITISLFCLMIMMVFEARQEKIGTYVILSLASGAEYYVLSKKNKKGVKNEK